MPLGGSRKDEATTTPAQMLTDLAWRFLAGEISAEAFTRRFVDSLFDHEDEIADSVPDVYDRLSSMREA